MAIDVKPQTPDVVEDELELLWDLPAKGPLTTAPPAGDIRFGRLIGYGWPAVLAGIMLFHPAPHPGAQDWAYTNWFTAAVFIVLGLGVIALLSGHATRALAASSVAGALGVVLAYECRVTAQHYGNWWAYELVAFGALTTLSLAALATRNHRFQLGQHAFSR